MTDVGPRTREMAARMCSARANAEAAPNGIDISHPSGGCFTPNAWKRREQALAYATFCTVIDGGANPRKMAENWAEAEARLRTNEYPTPDM